MFLRITIIALAATLAFTTACTNKKVSNPLAKVDSKQPDKVLFDRGQRLEVLAQGLTDERAL